MYIVIDTNQFIGNYRLESPQWRMLLDAANHLSYTVVVPEVVVDEVVNKFKEQLVEATQKMGALGRDLAKMLPDFDGSGDVDVETSVDEYRSWLKAHLEASGVRIEPYPSVSHREVVAQDLAGKKPFRQGRGYRDFLIWESVRTLANQLSSVVFVTDNSKDFGEDSPHRDLVAGLSDQSKVEVVKSVRHYVDSYVAPKYESVLVTQEYIQDHEKIALLERWLESNLLGLLGDEDNESLGLLVLNVGVGLGIYPSEFLQLDATRVESVVQLGGGWKVRVQVRATVRFSVGTSWNDYLRYPEVQKLLDRSDRFDWAAWDEEAQVAMTLDLAVNENGVVEAADVMSVD